MATDDDILGSRCTMERASTRFNIYFLLIMALLGSLLFIVGLVGLCQLPPQSLEGVPEPVLLIAIGMVDCVLFFPWFMTLYFSRHFLLTVKQLELENRELRGRVATIENQLALRD
jgi:hypothetical protein